LSETIFRQAFAFRQPDSRIQPTPIMRLNDGFRFYPIIRKPAETMFQPAFFLQAKLRFRLGSCLRRSNRI
jgi:hypothetical protein